MRYHEHGDLSYFTYSSLPIFNLTTSKKDISQKGMIDPYLEQFGIPYPKYCKHEHRDGIVIVESLEDGIQDGDALMTQLKGVPLMICHADCQAGILYDPKSESLALVHSGWRSSNLNIYRKVIQKMSEKFGTKPCDIIAVISPSLGPDHAEFIHYETELNSEFIPYQAKPLHFNFWEISRDQLLRAGVKNVTIASLCTFENPDRCFSYRRNKTRARDATIAML